MDPLENQLPVCLLAQLVEPYPSIPEVRVQVSSALKFQDFSLATTLQAVLITAEIINTEIVAIYSSNTWAYLLLRSLKFMVPCK